MVSSSSSTPTTNTSTFDDVIVSSLSTPKSISAVIDIPSSVEDRHLSIVLSSPADSRESDSEKSQSSSACPSVSGSPDTRPTSPADGQWTPSAIKAQLCDKGSPDRFRCFAYEKAGRCENKINSFERKRIFSKAQKTLADGVKGVGIDADTYVNVIVRILFCTEHKASKPFKEYKAALERHWTGDGNGEEKATLLAIYEATALLRPERPQKQTQSSPQPSTLEIWDHDSQTPTPSRSTRHTSTNSLSFDDTTLVKPDVVAFSAENGTTAEELAEGLSIQDTLSRPDKSTFISRLQSVRAKSPSDLVNIASLKIKDDSEASNYTDGQVSLPKDDQNDTEYTFNTSPPMQTGKKPSKGISQDDINLSRTSRPALQGTTIQQHASTPNVKSDRRGKQAPVSKLVDSDIRNVIFEDVKPAGHVYILRAPEHFAKNPGKPVCVKIGSALDVEQRVRSIQQKCGLESLERVRDYGDLPHHLYKKVEQLAHAELANFRRTLHCGQCRTSKGEETDHREWFEVSEEVVLRVVQRWRLFVLQEPYDDNGRILTHWSTMLKPENMRCQTILERDDDHDERDRRWREWLEDGIARFQRGTCGA